MDKNTLRKTIISQRLSLSEEKVMQLSNSIADNVKNTHILDYNNILIYSDFKNEVQTGEIISYLKNAKKNVYLPMCDTASLTMEAVPIGDGRFILNKYGIQEPLNKGKSKAELDCAIVPGVVFDINGNRIGFGAGYYDKFFALHDSVLKIGLCYEFQLINEIHSESHDIKMDIIVTEKRIIHTK